MTMINAFTPQTVENLKYYVYALVDASTNKICYIGKGTGQRIFGSLQQRSAELKTALDGYIIRHSLTETEAFLVEATLIDFLPYFSISDLPVNFQGGVGSQQTGIKSVADIENQYSAPIIKETDFQHNVLIISVNRSVGYTDTLLTPVKLYESTRKTWYLDLKKAQQVDYVIAKHNGLLKEIYKPTKWYEYPTLDKTKRYAFEGDVVMDAHIRELYLNHQLDKRSYGQPLIYIFNHQLSIES
jgi:uncharacterized protein